MNEPEKQVTDIQRNADEMVAAGFKKNLAMKVANIIERSIAVPIDGVKAEINGVKVEIEKLKNSLKWTLTHVVIPVLILFLGAGGYMSKQIYNLNADVGEVKGTIAQLDKRVDAQFEQVKDQFEQVDARFDRMDDRFDRFEEEVNAKFKEVDEQLADLKGRSIRMEEQGVQRDKVLNLILGLMKEKARVSSSVPEAVPGETDISFDPNQDQPTMKPKEDQIKGKLGSYPNQPGSTPLTKQADVGPDVQPMQAGQPKPPRKNNGGGIGGPEGPPLE